MLQCVKYKVLPLAGQWAEILVCFSREQFVDPYHDYDDNADDDYHKMIKMVMMIGPYDQLTDIFERCFEVGREVQFHPWQLKSCVGHLT